MPEPAATPAVLAQSTDRIYYIEKFYSLVAGATEDRIGASLRKDIQTDALHAAYAIEAWLEEVQAREEKYDRLATLARAVAPISDLLRILSQGAGTGFYHDLISSYEKKYVQSILAQRSELQQSAGEAQKDDLLSPEQDLLTALLSVVSHPDGRDDYVAWFQIGWLYWKTNVLDEAENAFRTAASFSQRQSPWYLAQSLRHEAFMQWRRANFERSRATMRRAIDVRRDPAMLVEAARYSLSCGQTLESQSMLDEALHVDPFIFLSVLSDAAFSGAITSTVDILVRQQARATEAAKTERIEWADAIALIGQAEKQAGLMLLPKNYSDEFEAAMLPPVPDFPTAVFRAEQARSSRLSWTLFALQRVEEDVAEKTRQLGIAENSYQMAEQSANQKLSSLDTEQRIAEMVIQDEHDALPLPLVPTLKEEMMNGFIAGLTIVVVGAALLTGYSQWRFGSIPPLTPVRTLDLIAISPIVVVMIVFGIFGFVSFPFLRLRKARFVYDQAARSAEFDSEQKLKKVANDAARDRETVKSAWIGKRSELQQAVEEAKKQLRAASAAHVTLKRISPQQK